MRKRKEEPKEYLLGGEFHEIVKETLLAHANTVDWQQLRQGESIESQSEVDVIAEAIEKKIKEKFHIFRINKLMTGD
jgi:hypothetical protein